LALEDEIKDVLKNFEQNLAGQNLDLDTYLKINTRKKEDFMEEDIKPAAKKRLEHALIMDEISRSEKIELDQDELQQEYARSFMQMQSAPDFEKMQKQYTKQKLANVTVMQAASRLMNQKTLERIKAYANGEMDAEKKEEAEKKAAPADKAEKGEKSEKKAEVKKETPAKAKKEPAKKAKTTPKAKKTAKADKPAEDAGEKPAE
jgi:FKBP-type peptidyl-prolyl cis-trans isomerase (trigger factor)